MLVVAHLISVKIKMLTHQEAIVMTESPCVLGWVTSEAALAWNALSKLPAALRKSQNDTFVLLEIKDKVAEQGVTDTLACKSSSSALWRVVKPYLGECGNWIAPNSLSHFIRTQHSNSALQRWAKLLRLLFLPRILTNYSASTADRVALTILHKTPFLLGCGLIH